MTSAEMQNFFPRHSRVLLKSCPHGQPGEVQGYSRGRVTVSFRDLSLSGNFSPDRLLSVVVKSASFDVNSPEKSPQFSQVHEVSQ